MSPIFNDMRYCNMFYDLILLLHLLFVDFLTVIFYVMMVVATLYKPNINADAKHI